MLADKLRFISWLMCKSPKYGGEKHENKKDRKTVGEGGGGGWRRGLEEENN